MNFASISKNIKSKVYYQEPMRLHTSWKIGGLAEIFIPLSCEEDLVWLLKFSQEMPSPFFVFGKGTNLLAADSGIKGITVTLSPDFSAYSIEGNVVKVQGGVSLSQLVRAVAEAGLSGLEFAAGIPGSVAGALVMNAGADGQSMSDIFLLARGITLSGGENIFSPKNTTFAYRSSSLRAEKTIITYLEFLLTPGDKDKIKKNIAANLTSRRERQPQGASAGSVFKNPSQGAAGWFIEKVGLKGMRSGGAMISEKHANFIINTGQATARDILNLMDRIKNDVETKFNISLEPEICLVGEQLSWEERKNLG